MKWVVSAEGKGLDRVLEVLVAGDRTKDLVKNVKRYAELGIPEYVAFDRTREEVRGLRGACTPSLAALRHSSVGGPASALHPAPASALGRASPAYFGEPMKVADVMKELKASLTTARVAKDPEGLDLPALLDQIEKEMKRAPAGKQFSMNHCLAEIGIHNPDLRKRAIAIGERLEVLKDYPTPKGCTSPFAPIWIAYGIERLKKGFKR